MLGKFLFLCQVITMALCVFPLSVHLPGTITLILFLLACLLFLWVLRHNRLGNWSVLPEPLQNSQLIQSGPYAWVRHPMYSVVLLACFVFVLHNLGISHGVSFIGLCVVLQLKARYEERFLKKHFADYGQYMAQVKNRFFPL